MTSTANGSCLGYNVTTALECRFLRSPRPGKRLEIHEWAPPSHPEHGGELLVRWRQRPDRPFHGSVHRIDGRLVVNTSDAGWFRIDPAAGRVEVPSGIPAVKREVRLWTTPMLLLSSLEGNTPLHAATVEIDGMAVAIAAPGGHGKTTLAAALAARGHRLMAEDITVIDEEFMVSPGPDLIRLRPPTPDYLEYPPTWTTVESVPDRFFVRTGTPDASPSPLHSVVFVNTGDETRLVTRTDARRLADLWQVAFHLPNMTDRTRSFTAIAEIAERVPIYELTRPLDWSVLDRTADMIASVVS